MKQKINSLRRSGFMIAAISMLAAITGPSFLSFSNVYAGQVQTRFVQMSSSTPSATAVTYNVSFKPTALTNIGGIVVDFCADSPIVGSTTCTVPTSINIGTAVSGLTGFSTSTGTWVTTSSTANTLFYTNATPQTPSAITTPINFQITNVTNPSTTASLYARIITFDTNSHATTNYTVVGTARAASFVGQLDYGGAAMSTATAVNISAAVMETLTFCVSAAAPGSACSGLSAPTLTIGHGSPAAVDGTAVDTATAYTQVSSNANSGVVVAVKTTSSTLCSGLSRDAGATCGIPGKGAFGAISAGTPNFGLNVADGTGGTGTVTHNANYGTTGGSYGMSTAAYGTYGDPIESSSAPTANVNSLLTYAATGAATVPAGIYTTTESLIATGTF